MYLYHNPYSFYSLLPISTLFKNNIHILVVGQEHYTHLILRLRAGFSHANSLTSGFNKTLPGLKWRWHLQDPRHWVSGRQTTNWDSLDQRNQF